jgi:23S rRNA-/tRNA-specific pseudouridylate synthase
VYPLTGRTNQIRIHFSKIRHPVLGEERFAFRRDFSVRAKRLMLHAKVLEFNHPVTNKRLHLRCGLPQDMQEFLDNYS